MPDIAAHLQARLLSTVVTRLIKPPDIALTTRYVAEPEVVQVPTRHGDVRCYVTGAAAGAALTSTGAAPPVHVNIHGGAFLIGAPRQDTHLVRAIAGEVGATVVNVDYSTAPRARYPQAHEECHDVLRWVRRSADSMGWDGERVSVGGGSAGANLALGALELARRDGDPAVRACVLVAPSVDQTIPPEQYTSPVHPTGGRAPRPFVSPLLVRSMQQTYFADVSRRAEPVASPVLAEDLSWLPPTLVVSAELDSLRPQIERFVDRAQAAGAPVTHHCCRGVDHDFPVRPRGAAAEAALRELAGLIRGHLVEHLA